MLGVTLVQERVGLVPCQRLDTHASGVSGSVAVCLHSLLESLDLRPRMLNGGSQLTLGSFTFGSIHGSPRIGACTLQRRHCLDSRLLESLARLLLRHLAFCRRSGFTERYQDRIGLINRRFCRQRHLLRHFPPIGLVRHWCHDSECVLWLLDVCRLLLTSLAALRRTKRAHLLHLLVEDLQSQSSIDQSGQPLLLLDLISRGCIVVVACVLPRRLQCSDSLDTRLLGSLPCGPTGWVVSGSDHYRLKFPQSSDHRADGRCGTGVLLWGRGWEVDLVRAGMFAVGLFRTRLARCLKIELQRQPGVDHPFPLFKPRGRAPNGRVETFSCLFPNRLQGCNSVGAGLLRGSLGSQSSGLVGAFLDCCS
eukprot:m.238416 g.238416  ORF g.238416 m.238416 type:complete len:364 (-) comp26232_c0_seq2:884-1975(-)